LANHNVVIITGANPESKVAAVLTVPTLDKVTVDLMVVLGTTTMPIHQVLRLSRGAIIELDATEADEVKVLANNLPVASGVVLVDRNRIAVEVKQMLPRTTGTRERPGVAGRAGALDRADPGRGPDFSCQACGILGLCRLVPL
jgi:flagellar motor switch protein FliN/FliY